MSRLLVLYPGAWRERYESEFLTLLAARPPGRRDRLDIIRGALDARLHPQLAPAPGDSRRMRVAGILSVVSGSLWVAASLAFHGASLNLELGYKESGSAILVAAAAALGTGLAAFVVTQYLTRRHRLVWLAVIATLLGAIAMAFPWPILLVGFMAVLFGMLLFGFVGAATGLGPSGVILGLTALLAFPFNTEDDRALLLIPLGVFWILFGSILGTRGIPTTIINLERLKAALRPPRNAI